MAEMERSRPVLTLRDVTVRKVAYTKSRKPEDEDSRLVVTLEVDPNDIGEMNKLLRLAESGSCTWEVQSIAANL